MASAGPAAGVAPAATLPAGTGNDRHAAGRIGPNAITRLAEALTAAHGDACCAGVFGAAGLAGHLDTPPQQMVDERDVVRLHRALVAALGTDAAMAVSQKAGRLTGRYLLAHRIPMLAQRLLRLLPRAFAARLLTMAIARHAWTFAGSGRFAFSTGDGLRLTLADAPLCIEAAPTGAAYLAATFETVFSAMLGPRTRVSATAGMGAGARTQMFEVTWVRETARGGRGSVRAAQSQRTV